jgi:hypothetical protein
MICIPDKSKNWKRVSAVSDASVVNARAMPPMTWNGTLVSADETVTHYLHLSVFPCDKCNGPVIAGLLGTRHNDISQETDIRNVGAACIACGSRPEQALGPKVQHSFRPVEWMWKTRHDALPAGPVDDPLRAEPAHDADV